MRVCIAEKPSVAKEIAEVLGAKVRRNGYFEGNDYCVTWTFGHLCSLQEPHEYTEKWRQWNLSMLPMIPSSFRIKLIDDDGIKRQFAIIEELFNRAEMVINCGDAVQVTIQVTTSEKTPVNIWMQGLHTTVHHFWETSHIIDGNGIYPSIIKGNLGPTC